MVTRSFASNYTGPKREKKNFKGEEKCTYLQKKRNCDESGGNIYSSSYRSLKCLSWVVP